MKKFITDDTRGGDNSDFVYSEVAVLPATGEEGIIYILPSGDTYIWTGATWLKLSSSMTGSFEQGTHSGLDFSILQGSFTLDNTTIVSNAGGIVALTDNLINYVGIKTDGTFYLSTLSTFDGLMVYPLYKVTTLSGAITAIEDNRYLTNLVSTDKFHIQNTDYKLDDYTQTIDITGLTTIDFLTGAKAITAGKNKIVLTSTNTTESFTITDFPSYEIMLLPETGLILNILPSTTLYTEGKLTRVIDGTFLEFINIKKIDSKVQEIYEQTHQYFKLEEVTSDYGVLYNSNSYAVRCHYLNGFYFIIDTNSTFTASRIRKFNSDWSNEELVYTHGEAITTRSINYIEYYDGFYYLGLWSSTTNQILKCSYNEGTNVFDIDSTITLSGNPHVDSIKKVDDVWFIMNYNSNQLVMYDSNTDGSFKNTVLKTFTDADGMQFGTNYIYYSSKIYANCDNNELVVQTISADRLITAINIYNLNNMINITGSYFKSRHTSATDYVYTYVSDLDCMEGGYVIAERTSLAAYATLANLCLFDYDVKLLCKIPISITTATRCIVLNNFLIVFDAVLGVGNFANQSLRIFKIK